MGDYSKSYIERAREKNGSLGKFVQADLNNLEVALKENKKEYTAHIYEEVNHGFHNDTTPRYDEASAKLAWQRTIDFFNEKLK